MIRTEQIMHFNICGFPHGAAAGAAMIAHALTHVVNYVTDLL